jgi:hypothetical protein
LVRAVTDRKADRTADKAKADAALNAVGKLTYVECYRFGADLLLLGHTKLESTVRYLGIEVNDALEMAEQTDV